MNFPRTEWNENIKRDLLEFLKTANKTNAFCNIEEYNRLSKYFPLSNEIKEDLKGFTEKTNVCIDITQSDDEVQNYEIVSKDHKNEPILQEDSNIHLNIHTLSLQDPNKNDCDDLIEMIKDNLRTEKNISITLLNNLLTLDNTNIEKGFCHLAGELTSEQLKILWNSLKTSSIKSDFIIESYVHFLLFPKAKQQFVYEIHEVFLSLCDEYGNVLKSELIKEFIQTDPKGNDSRYILAQYVASLNNDYKMQILRDFLYTMEKLDQNYIPIIEVLLNPQVNVAILGKLIEIMASVATEFCSDNAYGKLLFNTVKSFDRNLISGLDHPLKHILGSHQSIWKIKVEKIVSSWFNDSLTQSFI